MLGDLRLSRSLNINPIIVNKNRPFPEKIVGFLNYCTTAPWGLVFEYSGKARPCNVGNLRGKFVLPDHHLDVRNFHINLAVAAKQVPVRPVSPSSGKVSWSAFRRRPVGPRPAFSLRDIDRCPRCSTGDSLLSKRGSVISFRTTLVANRASPTSKPKAQNPFPTLNCYGTSQGTVTVHLSGPAWRANVVQADFPLSDLDGRVQSVK
jgi:hypothetical protein